MKKRTMKSTTLTLFAIVACAFVSHAQPINKLLNDQAPASPSAAIFQKRLDQKINTASGTEEVTVKIHELYEGPLQVNVNLSYNTAGIKVGEAASWVGLGWNLSGGGMISRTVIGYRDDDIHGYMTGECEALQNGITASVANSIIVGKIDCQADVFYLSIPGYGGKMIYAPHLDADGGWYVYPKSDIRVEEIKNGYKIYAFKITTPEGHQYLFGEEYTEESRYSNLPHIKKITSVDGLHSIYFNYVNEHIEAINLGSNVDATTSIVANGVTCNSTSNNPIVGATYMFSDSKRLTSITTLSDVESVTFVPQSVQREDLNSGIMPDKTKALDRIEITNGNSFCKKFQFNYSYTNANPSTNTHFYKRLILNSVQELSCNGLVSKPAFEFTYDDIAGLPQRLSKQIDHWGQYNGQINNESINTLIPNNAYVVFNGIKSYYGSDNPYVGCIRRPDTTLLKKGMLTKVKYPEGGNTTYTYEANTEFGCRSSGIYEVPVENKYSNCTVVSPIFNHTATCKIFTAQELMSAEFKLLMNFGTASTANDCGSMPPGRFNVKITAKEDYTSTPIFSTYTYTINQPANTEETPYMQVQSFFNPPLQAGVPYLFEMSVEQGAFYGIGDAYLTVRYLPEENNVEGGLRIKKVESRDTETSTPITTNYRYNDLIGHSTGVQMVEPVYGYLVGINLGFAVILKRYSSSPLTSTTDMQGNTIVYKSVKEYKNGLGYTEYKYNPIKQVNNTYPILPLPPIYTNDKIKQEATIDAQGLTVMKHNTAYEIPNLIGQILAPSKQYHLEKYTCIDGAGNTNDAILNAIYNSDQPSYARTIKDTILLNGVEEIKTKSYSLSETHTFPTKTSMVNSDGKLNETRYTFSDQYFDNTIKNKLLSLNQLLPAWQKEDYVDGVLADGTQEIYGFYDASGQITTSTTNRVYLHQPTSYKSTYAANGSPIIGGYQADFTHTTYDANCGESTIVYEDGYTDPVTYMYNADHLRTQANYLSHHTTYSYYANSNLLGGITAVDGKYTSSNYDPLMRLNSTVEDEGDIQKGLSYFFRDATHPHSGMAVKTIYAPTTPLSPLVQKETVNFEDGLGRDIMMLQVATSPSMQDVGVATTYDVHGRKSGVSIPMQASVNNNGAYFIPHQNTAYAITTYEDNMLEREKGHTPPEWYESTRAYGSNINAMTSPEGYTYAEHTLYKHTKTDADGKKKIAYTDKMNRLIIEQDADANESTITSTWRTYDNKNRESKIYPPGSSPSTPNLIFEKRYDIEDNLIYEKTPDKDAILYLYNNRNLLAAMRNPELATQGRWEVTQYDAYGRESRRGYQNNSTTTVSNLDNPTIDEVLHTTYYDGYNGSTTNPAPIYLDKITKKISKVLQDGGANTLYTSTENI
jgi:hypothetical protein